MPADSECGSSQHCVKGMLPLLPLVGLVHVQHALSTGHVAVVPEGHVVYAESY